MYFFKAQTLFSFLFVSLYNFFFSFSSHGTPCLATGSFIFVAGVKWTALLCDTLCCFCCKTCLSIYSGSLNSSCLVFVATSQHSVEPRSFSSWNRFAPRINSVSLINSTVQASGKWMCFKCKVNTPKSCASVHVEGVGTNVKRGVRF